MTDEFLKILAIARDNIKNNPSHQGSTSKQVAVQYLNGLVAEVKEVTVEIKEHNAVYLEDELSDIAWDFACVLAQLEEGGYIRSTESVFKHGLEKYSERAPAFLESTEDHWEKIKKIQKEVLKKRHEELYGN